MAKAVSKKGSTTKAAAATTKTKAAAKPSLLPPASKGTGKTVPVAKGKAGASDKKVTSPAAKVVDAKKGSGIAVRGEKEVKPTGKVQPVAVKPATPAAKPALPPRDLPKNGNPAAKNGVHTGDAVLKLKKKDRKEKKPINNPPVPPAPVLSGDAKAKKNQAGLTSRELEEFRDLLLAKRRELMGDMSSMEREALRTSGSNLSNLPIHMADMGTDNYEQEFTLGIVEKDRVLIREINQALAKIQNGSYGICEGTGKPIAKARLEVQPWAKYSIEYAREQEKRRGRF